MSDKLDRLIIDDTEYTTEVPEGSRDSWGGLPDPSEVRAFIPGTIVEIRTREGDTVEPGDVLLLLDAMKMHNEICSNISGRVRKIHVEKGNTVQKNQIMVEISKN